MRQRPNKLLYMALLGGLFWGCRNNTPSASQEKPYFNVKDYFQQEIERLAGERPQVEKTVVKNLEEERRSFHDLDWATELNVFVSSDINKPAWRTSYQTDTTATGLIYRAIDPELKIRSILINREPGKPLTGIVIHRAEQNYLYTSEETLQYYPDSLYSVERYQKVRLLGSDRFQITGRFK